MAAHTMLPVNAIGTQYGGPPNHDYYKRAVYRSAPHRFEVSSLPPMKIGRSCRFGLRIYPIIGDNVSAVSESTFSEYDIWRSWDDCLWFQDILELRYGVVSREKRQRLQAGKGVKKNGVYIHDHAASFESLPPGPDPKSVAKDIHQYLPKLTKRGTLFRATQATVDQRQKEFSALIKAFFQPNVPSLIEELREDRVIRDFFGYWRRDHDIAVKRDDPRPKTAPGDGISSRSFMSSFFSASTISLSTQHPIVHSVTPFPFQTLRSASTRRRPKTTESTAAAFLESTRGLPPPRPPSSAPARLDTTFRDDATSEDGCHTLGRKVSTSSSNLTSPSSPSPRSSSGIATSHRRANSHRTKSSSSPRTETFNVTSDFPLFLSSSTRDLLPSSRPPHSPTYVAPGLRTLPEDTEPGPSTSTVPLPSPRRPGRTNRNCAVSQDLDEVSSSEGDVLEQELLTPVDGAVFNVAVAKSFSSSSLQLGHVQQGSEDSYTVVDFPLIVDTDPLARLEHSISPQATDRSTPTLCRSPSGRRRRSLSQPLPFNMSVPTDVEDGEWSDHGEDIIEAYFGGPDTLAAPNEDSFAHYDGVSSEMPHDFPYDPPDTPSVTGFRTPRQKVTSIDRPLVAFHGSWMGRSLYPSPSPPAAISGLPLIAANEMLVVKAVLNDAIVVFRVERDVSFMDLRQRVHEKFARTEGMPLRDSFVLAYAPPVAGKRESTVSSMSTGSVDWARALPLQDEEEWATVVASCGSKITLRVSVPPRNKKPETRERRVIERWGVVW